MKIKSSFLQSFLHHSFNLSPALLTGSCCASFLITRLLKTGLVVSLQVVPAGNKPSYRSRGLAVHRWILWQELHWLSQHLLTQKKKHLPLNRFHFISLWIVAGRCSLVVYLCYKIISNSLSDYLQLTVNFVSRRRVKLRNILEFTHCKRQTSSSLCTLNVCVLLTSHWRVNLWSVEPPAAGYKGHIFIFSSGTRP